MENNFGLVNCTHLASTFMACSLQVNDCKYTNEFVSH